MSEQGERTYTQEEVNAIVARATSKVEGKVEGVTSEFEEKYAKTQAELEAERVKVNTMKTLSKAGLPVELADVVKDEKDIEVLKETFNTLQKPTESSQTKQIPTEGYYAKEEELTVGEKLVRAFKGEIDE